MGLIAWNVENMYFNTFLYNSVYAGASAEAIAGTMAPTTAISRMVAISAITAVLTTFIMGTLSDKMRKRNDKTIVVFITSYPKVIAECIKVQPYRFLSKPIDNEKLYEALDSFVERYNSDAYVLVCDDENDKMKRLAEWDILYAEADNIYCKIIKKTISGKGRLRT